MKRLNIILTLLLLAAGMLSAAITTPVPPRPDGQTHMLAFAADPIDTVRVGFIGLGMRGPRAVERFVLIP